MKDVFDFKAKNDKFLAVVTDQIMVSVRQVEIPG